MATKVNKAIREELDVLLTKKLNGHWSKYNIELDEIREEIKDLSEKDIKALKIALRNKLDKQ